MKMNVFEYAVTARGEDVAGFDNLEHASMFALKLAKHEHCDVDIINAFTGEVHLSLCSYLHITYNADKNEVEKFYEVKERAW